MPDFTKADFSEITTEDLRKRISEIELSFKHIISDIPQNHVYWGMLNELRKRG